MMYNEGVCNNESCFMPKTKIPVYFFKKEDTIKCQYVTPLELYKISHWEDSTDNEQFYKWFIGIDNMNEPHAIGTDLEEIKELHKRDVSSPQQTSQSESKEPEIIISDSEESDTINLENEEIDIINSDSEELEIINSDSKEPEIIILENEETNTINSEGEKTYTIQPINYNDLLNDNSKTLYRCIDIYGNIVEVFIPNDKINDKKYWIAQARQYKLLCDFDYLPFHYSSKNKKLEEVAEEMAEKICRKTTAYCFYDTEMEGEYYKCHGIKFPVEEKEEKGKDLQTIKSQPLKLFTNDFPKVKIYYKEEIEDELKSNYFFHETSFKIGDTEIDLTPSKEEMGRSRSSPEYGVARGYLPNEKNPETEVIALIDSNKIKNYSVATDKEFVARITINRKTSDGNYGKVTKVELGIKNKESEQKYEAAEARKLLLVNCARKDKDLAKTTEESFLDLVLSNLDYYEKEDCSVRLPDCCKIESENYSKEKLKEEIELCTKNFSSGCNIIIPTTTESHMFVIIANKKDDKISFKIFDPSTALGLENKENIKQDLGDYIYENLDEKYILSPDTPIQNTLIEHNPIFSGICTGVSMEYINYIIDNKQDKNPQQLTEEEGKKIQISYAQSVVNNGLHHMILEEQQIDTSSLYNHILLYNNGTLKLVKYSDYKNDSKKYKASDVVCAINSQEIIIQNKFNNDIPEIKRDVYEDEDEHYKIDYVEFPVYVNNKKLELTIFANGETLLCDELLEYSTSVDLTGFDTSPLFNATSNSIPENGSNKSSETVTRSEDMEPIIDIRPEDMEQEDIEKECRGFEANKQAQNTLQEKTTTVKTKAFQETRQVKQDEVVDKKEVKPEVVSVAVNGTDKKPIQEEITVRNAPVETPKEYPIETKFVDDELNIDLIKHKEEEQKKKEEEQKRQKEEEQKKKETRSIIPAFENLNTGRTNKKSEEKSSTLSSLSKSLGNERKYDEEQKLPNKQEQEQETVKDSGLIKRKGRYK